MVSKRIRTLLVDDSAIMRKLIRDLLSTDESIELVGTANNGLAGSELTLELKPDVVITDMVMPEYDGLFLVKSVMSKIPTPIILLSALDKSNVRIFDALQQGAFEFIDKPREGTVNYPLLQLIKEASYSNISLLRQRQLARRNTCQHTFQSTLNYDIIVVGASTGGPGAVESVVHNLPFNLQIPVVIAQHMPTRFIETFAERLNGQSKLPVKIAESGEPVRAGTIYLTSGEANTFINRHLVTDAPSFFYTNSKYAEFNNPSVDCLFESVADVYGDRSIGVILTGMGRDGSKGLAKIRNAGGYTIAQDEASSVVYGMPKAAVECGATKQIVKLAEIPGFIISCL